MIRGDTRVVNCTFLQADGLTPINLTSGTAYFTVNEDEDPDSDSTAIIQKSTTTFTDAANGLHTFTLSASETNIPAGDYWYDAQFVDVDGNKVSAYRGKFVVQSDITRA